MNKETVSVCLITYNSSSTVIETLNSILNQDYGSENIELVISDDASPDNTVNVLDEWVSSNKGAFSALIFIKNEQNGGISRNCNNVWKNATSNWIKTIAGDDLLLPSCITDNVEFSKKHKNASVIFSRMIHFKEDDLSYSLVTPLDKNEPFFEMSSAAQFNYLSKSSFNFAPSSFISRTVLEKVGFCDEKYKLIEDLPLWLKLTSSGVRFYLMKKNTVSYRISNSLSNSTDRLINLDFIRQIEIMHEDLIWPKMKGWQYWRVLDKKIDFFSWRFSAFLFNNKKHSCSVAVRTLIALLRPSAYISLYKRLC